MTMTVLNIGSGPITTGNMPGLTITNADRRDYGAGVEHQDMEAIAYPDNTFDLVACVNALDHTKDAEQAVREMIRVSKHWVYIDCALIQHTTSGKGHYWDALETGVLQTADDSFDLTDYGFKVEFIDNHADRRYNHIVATLEKPNA